VEAPTVPCDDVVRAQMPLEHEEMAVALSSAPFFKGFKLFQCRHEIQAKFVDNGCNNLMNRYVSAHPKFNATNSPGCLS